VSGLWQCTAGFHETNTITLYVGVTSNLSRRVWEHREGIIDGFKALWFETLVYYEPYDDIRNALQREKNLKHWPRLWKLALIHDANPDWEDLYEKLNW
jgi:putative endonuclease